MSYSKRDGETMLPMWVITNILQRFENGERARALAMEFGCSDQAIYAWRRKFKKEAL